ncbi:cation-independent mannose-6-phosphate receptor isoform X2 [Contarinia nasturtii]|uniref:cation-independent mannose-6-phosphate receptor isoform X2 n=1 Tax=Contarinia nasturtii TaxID=265458 RepID=UPI0012D3A045|nr:cation-independent mannose-6-phosphate receptor isoform X2 [Contarinia nasturtii]
MKNGDVKGSQCKLTEPVYGTQFDLSKLHSELGLRINGEGQDFIEFNVCGNLTKVCAGAKSAACLTRNGKQLKFGTQLDAEPIYTNGRIYFNFTGDVCDKDTNETFSLLIITTCDYSSHISSPTILMPYSQDQCAFVVIWRTRYACHPLSGPLSTNTCTAKDPKTNHTFNLMQLSDYNHKVLGPNQTEFLINICKPTLYGHNEMCPPNVSVCLDNKSKPDVKKRFKNYGTTVTDPTYENGKLFMKFTSDEKCNATTNKYITSIINFVCDEMIELGQPEYTGERDCEHSFTWITSLACNQVTPCRTIDPITGFVYDLNALSGQSYRVQHGNQTYVFGVCSEPKEPCNGKAGACLVTGDQKGQSASLGIVNSELQLSEEKNEAPYILYKSGSACDTQQWTTKIEFACEHERIEAGPKVIEDTNCTLLIQFPTELVCRNDIQCKAHNIYTDEEIDLTPLKSSTHNYLARINDTIKSKQPNGILYYLNVCKPLVPQYGLSCNANSAACRAITNGTKNPEQEQSLGYPRASLTFVRTEHGSRPQLKYFDGNVCPQDKQTKLSSQIEFYCDPAAGKGTPILQSISNECHYEFEWATNIMCPMVNGEFREETCELYNPQINHSLDLRQIFTDGMITIPYADKNHRVDLCKKSKKIEIDYTQSIVKMFFDETAVCGSDSSINVEMRLVCNEIQSHTFTTDTASCGSVYVMETPLICPQLAIEVANNAGPKHEAKTIKHSFWGALLITAAVTVLLLALIVLVLRNPNRRYQIMHLFRRGGASVHYSRVRRNEEANLLLDQPDGLSDSDEDLLI